MQMDNEDGAFEQDSRASLKFNLTEMISKSPSNECQFAFYEKYFRITNLRLKQILKIRKVQRKETALYAMIEKAYKPMTKMIVEIQTFKQFYEPKNK